MRSRQSRFLLFSAAASLLVSFFVSTKIQSSLELIGEKGGIYADFSPVSNLFSSGVTLQRLTAIENVNAEKEILAQIQEARADRLFESPILIPIRVVREVYGPSPYRLVRVRFDLNQWGLKSIRDGSNWIRVVRAGETKKYSQNAQTAKTTTPVTEPESIKLARLHNTLMGRMATQVLSSHAEVINITQSTPTSPSQSISETIETAEIIQGQEARRAVIAPVTVIQAAQITFSEPDVPQNNAIQEPAAPLDEVPFEKPKKVVSIQNKKTDVDIHRQLVESVHESQVIVDDLDSHVTTIDYSELPEPEAQGISQSVRAEKQSEEVPEISEKEPDQAIVAASQTAAHDVGKVDEAQEPKIDPIVINQGEVPAGPVLVSSFDHPIRLTQSSAAHPGPPIQELVEKVNRLKPNRSEPPPIQKAEKDKTEIPQTKRTSHQPDAFVETREKGGSAQAEKISFTQAGTHAVRTETVDKRTCDTALIGQEAFSSGVGSDEKISVCRRVISFEGSASGSGSRWWEVRESVNHWPTLIHQRPESALIKNDRIPVLSVNTVKILSALSKTQAQLKSTGIIIGELPPGLNATLSGRSEAVMYFDARLQMVDAHDAKQARYFAFLNVEPGLPLLNVTLKSGNGAGTIALLVQSGSVTYVRVPSPRVRKISGTVFDAVSAKAAAISKATVQVVGQPGKQAVSDRKGNFEIGNVLTFDDHPLFIDVSSGPKEFKHRYRVNPEESRSLSLFRFGAKEVSNWIQQLEGGVSPMSGLIVAALPGLFTGKELLEFKIGTLDRKNVLKPEVYGLGPADVLQDSNKIQSSSARVLSVQVPEGPNIPSAFDLKGKLVWSETVYSQPGVINVVAQ